MRDISAIGKEMELGMKTQTEILAERGMDFTDWCEIKAQEMAIAERYGVQLPMFGESPELPPEDDDDDPPPSPPPADDNPNGDRLLDSPPKRVPRKQKKRQKWR